MRGAASTGARQVCVPAEDDGDIGDATDEEMLRATDAELGPAPDPLRGHHVIDPEALRVAIGDHFDWIDRDDLSSEEARRVDALRRLGADPDALWRAHLVADTGLIARLEALRARTPNGASAIDIVVRAARISAKTGAPIDVPPLLLLELPGCGKSFLVRELGVALGVPVLTLLGSTMADATAITGSGVGWKGAGPGRLAELLLRSPTSAPLVFVDEIEKLKVWERREVAADILLGVLDRGMAAAHEDLFYRVPMRADRAVYLAAANAIDGLSEPFLDRVIVVEMRPPDRDERRAIVERIYRDISSRLGLEAGRSFDERGADLLDDISLRRVGPALQIALGRAVEAGRDCLEQGDVEFGRAAVERGRAPARRPIGFLHGGG